MLAYVFWHRPYPQTEQKSYEAAIEVPPGWQARRVKRVRLPR